MKGPDNGLLHWGSVLWRWTFLLLATLWAIGVARFIFGYHINEPSTVLSVTTGGHTFVGHPPALTLYERDGPIWEVALVLTGLVLSAGAIDLVVRTARRSVRPGVLAFGAGGLLVAYSLFGLVYGLLGIGTIGVLVILVGLPMRSRLAVGVDSGTPTLPI
jgi:hypothetical protein